MCNENGEAKKSKLKKIELGKTKWRRFLKLFLILIALTVFQSCKSISKPIESIPACDDENVLNTVKHLLLKLYCRNNWGRCNTYHSEYSYAESLIGVKLKYVKETSYNSTNKERSCEGYGVIVGMEKYGVYGEQEKKYFWGEEGEFIYSVKEVINIENENKEKDWIVEVKSFFDFWHSIKDNEAELIFKDLEEKLELFEGPDLTPYNPARGVKADGYYEWWNEEYGNKSDSKSNNKGNSKGHKQSPREKILNEIEKGN